jgi:Endonuclease NucS
VTEREMEDLLWEHPEKFLNEPLRKFQRQPASAVGRADVIFEDRIGRLLVIELKRDTLERGAIMQLVDYYGMLKSRFPDRSIELMVVPPRIPPERRVACEQYDIEAREIPQKRFRDVADEVGYVFESELRSTSPHTPLQGSALPIGNTGPSPEWPGDSRVAPTKVEKGWYYLDAGNGRGYFAAFVNARGSCSMRLFDTQDGAFRKKTYKTGNFQESFSHELASTVRLHLSRQPNLERDCRVGLPETVLAELRAQIQQ